MTIPHPVEIHSAKTSKTHPTTRESSDILVSSCERGFIRRHVGPDATEVQAMLAEIECDSLDELVDCTLPKSIRLNRPLAIGEPREEFDLIKDLRAMSKKNKVFRSFIGQGYYGTITPPVIQRNVLENPGWYTQYTPYQAEIAQGRLEALLNFQTMVADLTGLPLANASLLDEATAAAEAMTMCLRISGEQKAFFVSEHCHPQTIAVVKTRAKSHGVEVVVGDEHAFDFNPKTHGLSSVEFCGVLVQYPTTDGRIQSYESIVAKAREHGAVVVAATDLLALTLIKPPGEWGADIAVGSAQRFGVPMGFGGPHAAFLATHEVHARKIPGRIIGVSRDTHGNPALRMAIQTREQHIKRDRATSNICTAQVLLAIMASMYAVYHGPRGLKEIARRVRGYTSLLARAINELGHEVLNTEGFFDTIRVRACSQPQDVLQAVHELGVNIRQYRDGTLGVAIDETTTLEDVNDILIAFGGGNRSQSPRQWEVTADDLTVDQRVARRSEFLTHPVFNTYHSETEMLRYITKLQSRDLSLAHSMIPLGSCTMKLNATSEMLPITWPEFSNLHPYAPADQWQGYRELIESLESWLCEITGFAACSLQPNAGSQGEYAGLLAIRGYHDSQGQRTRNICLIPTSAHGTNPASAIVAGMQVVPVKCDQNGNIDIEDLRSKAAAHRETLAAFMITYPSTHGVFEESIGEMCDIVHASGGLVYLDGANMNAQVGLCRPGDFGADVCHLNLHKTFCIPHGGGGPGMGPICCTEALKHFLPSNPLAHDSESNVAVGPVSAAPFGSASILPISWVYIAMMGGVGLKHATEIAILNANYMAKRLEDHYDILYRGRNGRVAHEFILDCREFKKNAGVEIDDIAKRLMDYSFHAPTMSFPVPGTLMIEPTESESKSELDRFCDALISIRAEIREIEQGEADREDNVLKGAPHTIAAIIEDEWVHPYSRRKAVYPLEYLKDSKFWPFVGRVDNPFGDRNLVCSCPPVQDQTS